MPKYCEHNYQWPAENIISAYHPHTAFLNEVFPTAAEIWIVILIPPFATLLTQ
jgi:hypothetical protein